MTELYDKTMSELHTTAMVFNPYNHSLHQDVYRETWNVVNDVVFEVHGKASYGVWHKINYGKVNMKIVRKVYERSCD